MFLTLAFAPPILALGDLSDQKKYEEAQKAKTEEEQMARGGDVESNFFTDAVIGILDYFGNRLLSIFGLTRDPSDYVFYCSEDRYYSGLSSTIDIRAASCAGKQWAMYTVDAYNNTLRRGFGIISIIAYFLVSMAIVKIGTLYSLNQLSSTLKSEFNEQLLKCLLAVVLIGNFFPMVGSMFKFNDVMVELAYQDIKSPLRLNDYAEYQLAGVDFSNITNPDAQINGKRMNLEDIVAEENAFKRVIITLLSLGLRLWWDVFYLQRYIVIGLICVLAPLWIAMLFYPKWHTITFTALKELWSQIIAQCLHAWIIWFYFNMFDTASFNWFQTFIAFALIIPISETVRYIFGATSESGSKLAMLGTAAGAGLMIHSAKAIGGLAKGGMQAAKEHMGQGQRSSSGGGHEGPGNSGKQSGESDSGMNSRQKRMRLAGNLGKAFGGAAGRFGGAIMGSGLGPIGQYAGGEMGDKVGQSAGYRSGVAGQGVGEGAVQWAKNTEDHWNAMSKQEKNGYGLTTLGDDPNQIPSRTNTHDRPANKVDKLKRAAQKGLHGDTKAFEDPSLMRQNKEQAYGQIAEAVLGENGYELGSKMAQSRFSGKVLSSGSFKSNENVYTVETSDGSYLARKEGNEYSRVSNIGKSNGQITKGQVVVTAYKTHRNQQGAVEFKRLQEPSATNPKMNVDMPAMVYDSEHNALAYQGKTASPNSFLEQGEKNKHIDMRRSNFKQHSSNE